MTIFKVCLENFIPHTPQELLAVDLARGLDDSENLAFYLHCTKHYPEPILRSLFSKVKNVPAEKIKKSRGALFNYLIQKYAKPSSNRYCH